MKKIFINALSALQGGGQTYLINLFKYRPKSDYIIYLLVHKKNKYLFKTFENDNFILIEDKMASGNIIQRVLFEKFKLHKLLKKLNIDVYYAPGGIMNIKTSTTCKTVVAFRNMLPLQKSAYVKYPFFSYMRIRNFLLRYLFLSSFEKVDKIIFVSLYARNVIKKYYLNIDSKSIIIYHGLNKLFLEEAVNNNINLGYDYYLYVSILDVYKSQLELVDSWKILKEKYNIKEKLVLIGFMYESYGRKVLEKIKKMNLENDIIYLGEVNYEDLPKYYQKAKALIFASICENCPNILLEKMASKKMIFCSNHQPMPEFGKDGVIYFNPMNPKDLVEKIIKNDAKKIKEKYERRSYDIASGFDWAKTSKETFKYLLED